jgi:hypothetical protein
MKLFKLFMFCVLQLPISVFYYLDPTNPIYFIIWQYGITLFIFMMDNAISLNYHNINAINYNFEELLKKITKAVPASKEGLEKEFDNE